MKAMIFAAGLGTRLKPLTDTLPKALVPINGKPMLEHTIQRLKNSGVEEIVVNVHHFADQIIDFLQEKKNFGIHIEVSDEREKLLDTGGGIKKTARFFNDGKPFLIHNVDIFSNVNLNEIYKQHLQDKKNRLATLVVSQRETNRYLLFDDEQYLRGWINRKTGEVKPRQDIAVDNYQPLAYAGIQVVSPAIFQLMEEEPDKFPIIDFYLHHCYEKEIAGFVPENLEILDVGKLDILDKAEEFEAQLRRQ